MPALRGTGSRPPYRLHQTPPVCLAVSQSFIRNIQAHTPSGDRNPARSSAARRKRGLAGGIDLVSLRSMFESREFPCSGRISSLLSKVTYAF